METRPGRILVVDDEAPIVGLLKEFLTDKGYEVHTAFSGEEAIAKVKEVRPHIVFLDIIMPDMNGISALREIKKADPAASVIMATAISDEKTANEAVKLGACDYIIKPFDLKYFETVVMVKLIQMLG